MVPIAQTVLSDGTIRYSVPMRINGQVLQVMLDSGSTGLRLMPAAADRLHLEPGRVDTTYRFSNGVALTGSLVKVRVAIAAMPSATVLAQDVFSVSCSMDEPSCPASGVMDDRFRIGAAGGDNFMTGGFLAILGVGLQPASIPNPLTVLGNGRWIIDLPLPIDRHPGKLVLDPGRDELESYATFPLRPESIETASGRATGWRDMIPGCLRKKGGGQTICRPMLLDTGGSGFYVTSSRVDWPTRWRTGSDVVLVFESMPAGPGLGFEFRSGRVPLTTVFLDPPDRSAHRYSPPPIYCGVMPYYYFSVAYDAVRGVIGLKVRPNFASSADRKPR